MMQYNEVITSYTGQWAYMQDIIRKTPALKNHQKQTQIKL